MTCAHLIAVCLLSLLTMSAARADEPPQRLTLTIPDTPVVDQHGRRRNFKSELVGDRAVAINFVFTTCSTICPLMAANFTKLQGLLGDRLGRDVSLISISIDPVTDTPERLKAWGAKFGAGAEWSLLTGDPREITALLSALGVSVPDKTAHAPVVLLGRPASGEWVRVGGFAAPELLRDTLVALAKPVQAEKPGFRHYLGDVADAVLTNQDGASLRLYDDLLKGKIVVVSTFFTTCQSACPILMSNLGKLQAVAGDRLGKDVSFLSISVDPATDTPEKLKTYAQGLKPRPGWQLLTGEPETVERVLAKFGQAVGDKEDHYNVLVMGNVAAGQWKKVIGFASPEALAASLEPLLKDETVASH